MISAKVIRCTLWALPVDYTSITDTVIIIRAAAATSDITLGRSLVLDQ